ncbi:hypothetical protein T03_11187, partial [Trichinella britovi]
LHDATLTISNDQSPYFHSSPFPLPVALDRPPRRPPPSCPLTGTSHVRSLLVPCWPETGFKEMTLSICVRQLCKFAIDVVLRLCFSANLVVIVTPQEE